jgi:hypothetical protein
MNLLKSKIYFLFSLLILITGMSAYTIVRAKRNSATLQRGGYTLVQYLTHTYPDQREEIRFISVRHLSSDGNFVETRERNGKQSYMAFSNNGKFFTKDYASESLYQIGVYNPEAGLQEEALMRSAQLRKDNPIEWVSGIKCYVMHIEDKDVSKDIYLAPAINAMLQYVYVNKHTNVVSTLRTVSITFGDPDKKNFEDLPIHLPVRILPEMINRRK